MFRMAIQHLEKTPIEPNIQKAFIRRTINGTEASGGRWLMT